MSDLRDQLIVARAAARALPEGDVRKLRIGLLLVEAEQCVGVVEARLRTIEELLDRDVSDASHGG